jgi:hypothetical protein
MHGIINPGSAVNCASPLNRGLVSWWLHLPNRLGGGGNTFRDLMRRNHGTLTNGPTWNGPRGRPGGFGSIGLVPSDDFVGIADAAGTNAPDSLKITGAITLGFWCYLTTTGTYSGIGRGQSLGGASSFCYYLTPFGTSLFFGISNGTTANTLSSVVLSAGQWFHAAATWSGQAAAGATKIFLNGVQINSGTPAITSLQDRASTRAWIGGTANDAGFSIFTTNGFYDDCFIYNRELSPSEIWNRFVQSRSGFPDTLNWQRSRGYAAQVATGNRRRRLICGASA